MKRIFVFLGLLSLFFFGEIALSFSDKGYPSLLTNEEIPFSLLLDNQFSDYKETGIIDHQVSSFINKWRIRGVSLAITKDERLVYAKGFGIANNETGEEVKPGHLFRIASVSKLITAVAIMKLYEENRLDLDERVFGMNGILNDSIFKAYRDKRIESVTIRHLLNHTAGWSGYSGDPMFNSLSIARKMGVKAPVSFDHVVQYALSRRLNYKPGTRYSYSNLGYAIEGKT